MYREARSTENEWDVVGACGEHAVSGRRVNISFPVHRARRSSLMTHECGDSLGCRVGES